MKSFNVHDSATESEILYKKTSILWNLTEKVFLGCLPRSWNYYTKSFDMEILI